MKHSQQVSQFKQEHLDKIERLDSKTKIILDAITKRLDVFQAADEAQINLTTTLHESTTRNINDARQEIIREIRVIFTPLHRPVQFSNLMLILNQATTPRYCPTRTLLRKVALRCPGGF